MARLELALGVKLFHRTTRLVTLTPDGERLFQRCQRVLAEVEDLQAEASGTRAAPAGTLRIDLPVYYGKRFVMPLLADLQRRVATLQVGQRVLVNRIGHSFTKPSVGDVVVFHPPQGADGNPRCGVEHPSTEVCSKPVPERDDVNFIKRVVAGPVPLTSINSGRTRTTALPSARCS